MGSGRRFGAWAHCMAPVNKGGGTLLLQNTTWIALIPLFVCCKTGLDVVTNGIRTLRGTSTTQRGGSRLLFSLCRTAWTSKGRGRGNGALEDGPRQRRHLPGPGGSRDRFEERCVSAQRKHRVQSPSRPRVLPSSFFPRTQLRTTPTPLNGRRADLSRRSRRSGATRSSWRRGGRPRRRPSARGRWAPLCASRTSTSCRAGRWRGSAA